MEENHQEIRIAMCSVEDNMRKLQEASKMGSIEDLKTLLQDDPNLIQRFLTSTSITESPLLHLSISHGHLELTRLLLDHEPELATEVDAFQRTPLHLASANGDMETVRALLEKNTSACLVYDKNGLLPLHYAVMNGKIETMQELINARPQSVWMKLDNKGQTILHLCVQGNHLEAIKLLLTQTVANREKDFVNTMDDAGNTILDLSLMLRQSEMVGYLLSIPEVKTGITSTAKESLGSSQKEKSTNSKRQERRESTPKSSAKKTIGCWKVRRNKLKYRGDWIQEVQGTMMLVATVIATVTFQAAINPPGGVWQQDTQFNSSSNYTNEFYLFGGNLYDGSNNGTIFPAGTAVMAYQRHTPYLVYLMTNTVSFLASVTVILLIISRFPLKNKICSWMLVMTMCVAVVFLTAGYLQVVTMVSITKVVDDIPTSIGYISAVGFWLGVVLLVGLVQVIRFFVWAVKKLFCLFTFTLKSCFYCATSSR